MEEKKVLLKEADLLEMVGRIMKRWKFVLTVSICFALFGLVIALSTVKSYTSEVVVAPESSSSISSSGISSLASIVGIDLGMSGGEDAIYPLLYPDIVYSLPFLTSLFDVNVKDLKCTVDTTYYTYLKDYSKKTWLDYVIKLPGKTLGLIRGLFASSDEGSSDIMAFDPYMLTKKQMSMVENLRSNLSIFVDKKTNVITLSFTDRDPRVAAIMTDTIMNRLQKEITEYRTRKVVNDCEYIEKMYLEAKDSLQLSQERYADFLSRNRNVINEHVIIEKERLVADKELKTAIHTQWAQQLLLAKAKVQESTPVFVTLKPATIPVLASSMSRSMMLVLFTFLGGVFAVLYILLKEPVLNICKRLFLFE